MDINIINNRTEDTRFSPFDLIYSSCVTSATVLNIIQNTYLGSLATGLLVSSIKLPFQAMMLSMQEYPLFDDDPSPDTRMEVLQEALDNMSYGENSSSYKIII